MNRKLTSRVATAAAIFFVTGMITASPILLPLLLLQPAHAFTRDWIPMYSDLVYAPVAASGDNVYVTWWTNKTTGKWDAFLAISTDNGKTFGDVIKLTNSTGRSFDTRIDASGDNVYVTWLNNKTGVNQIYFKASNDGGKTFSDEVMVNSKLSGKGQVAKPSPRIGHGTPVISSGDNVYMTWFEDVSGGNKSEVFLKASNDGGKTFGNIINLSKSPNARSDDPAIAAEDDNVYVTFWDDKTGPRKPFFVASNDGGQSFSNPIMLNATNTTTTASAKTDTG